MNASLPLILASASPRRHVLLQALGLTFSVHTADVDETPYPEESPTDLVCRLSQKKAKAIATHHPHALIIAADTIVVFDEQILGKPAHPLEARTMLTRLSGQVHYVYTAITLLHQEKQQIKTALHQSDVTMRPYTNAEIEAYVVSGDPLDKAGAYAIQNRAFAPVAKLSGCYASVMGLPLGLLAEMLAEFGIVVDKVREHCAHCTGQSCCL